MSDTKIENFKDIKVNINYEKIIDKYGQDTAKYLQRTSPRGHRRNKTYASGWEFKVDEKAKKKYGGVVWNATNYQLTHLLEKGHLIVNKKGGIGWASAKPHIENAYQHIKPNFIRAMENVDLEIE